MKLIGFIVNPIAGLGGSVGLKGTDGDLYKQALEMGAEPIVPRIVKEFLNNLKGSEGILFLTAPAQMGEQYLAGSEFKYKVVGEIGNKTTAMDTKKIAKLLQKESIDILIFFGGDGTARDIFDAVGLDIPVVAVPCGVKMFSGVFAVNPRAAATILETVISNNNEFEEREILDIDEESYRNGVLKSKLYGYFKVPKMKNLIQAHKDDSRTGDSIEINKNEIAQNVIERMKDSAVYLLGPGTTVKAICDELKQPKTLLGIDAIYQKKVIGLDLNEDGILKLMQDYGEFWIIISPIGLQGFIFGRGNKPFTALILKKVGLKNIIIIATRDKLRNLKLLRVDTGERALDESFRGFFKVIVGYKEEIIKQVK